MVVHVLPKSPQTPCCSLAYLDVATHMLSQSSAKGEGMTQTQVNKHETILVVDDNPPVLALIVMVLQVAGFQVLSAVNAAKAIEVAAATEGKIDLLLSDIDMPEMSGPDLGEALKKTRSGIHVMLMSGGPEGNLLVLNYGWAFIQKPFVPAKLVQMINNVLHSANRSQPGGQEFDSRKDWPKLTTDNKPFTKV